MLRMYDQKLEFKRSTCYGDVYQLSYFIKVNGSYYAMRTPERVIYGYNKKVIKKMLKDEEIKRLYKMAKCGYYIG